MPTNKCGFYPSSKKLPFSAGYHYRKSQMVKLQGTTGHGVSNPTDTFATLLLHLALKPFL